MHPQAPNPNLHIKTYKLLQMQLYMNKSSYICQEWIMEEKQNNYLHWSERLADTFKIHFFTLCWLKMLIREALFLNITVNITLVQEKGH